MRPRVLHVIPGLDPSHGGPSRSVPDLCAGLAKAGIDVTLLTTARNGAGLSINPDKQPYPVHVARWSSVRPEGAAKVFWEVARTGRDFDIVHIHSLWNTVATAAMRGAQLAGAPYIVAPRGMLDAYNLGRRRRLKRAYSLTLDLRAVAGATRMHWLNQAEERTACREWFRVPPGFVAPNGIHNLRSDDEPGKFRAKHEQIGDRPLVVFLGRLHPIKGLDLQLDALKLLVADHPQLAWVWIGPDNGEWSRLEERIRVDGLGCNLLWLGPLYGDERFEALCDADVVVQTSLYECHSVAVNEALSVGVPMVITDTVHFDEVGTCGAGRVVQRDAGEVARAVQAILSSRELQQSMRQSGRAYAQQNLLWSQVAGRIIAEYELILGERGKRTCVA